MPYLEKFFEKSLWALSSQNQTEEGIGSEEEDAPECRGFWDGVNLCSGAIKQLKGERETIRKVPTAQCISKYK